MIVWMNLYRQGWYHRAGKPGTLNMHPGDLYPTEAEAIADIDPQAPYVGTVQVALPEYMTGTVGIYPPGRTPAGLKDTREQWRQIMAGERAALMDDSGLVL